MERSADVEAAVADFYAVMRRGDVTAVTRLLSPDLTAVVGTDDAEWWEGYENASAAFVAQLEAAGQLGFEAGSLRGYSVGDFAWFEDRAGIGLDYGDSLPVRVTGVLHREDGTWRVVQMHVSMGTPNAEVGLTDLPV
jgi:ketosteroid isomerase-like protein